MKEHLATYLSNMRRICIVMLAFGLTIGMVFPLVVNPFVTWNPGQKIYFQLACLVAGLAVGIFCFSLIRITLYRQKQELEEAKHEFTSLTEASIKNHEFDAVLHDPDIPTCWEVKNCKDSKCPVYGQHNMRCWLVKGTMCEGEVQGQFAQKLESCSECEVYASVVQKDPISEIGENFTSLMWVIHEREEQLAQANKQLQEMATTDSLTGLKNHGHFQEELSQEMARSKRFDHPLSLIILDLDHFKNVNDKFGHQSGDVVLKSVGRFLRNETRKMDYVARYGGEEFAIILPETMAAAAIRVAEKLRVKIKEFVAAEAGLPPSYIGASFGVADYPNCAADKDSLIAAADSALLFTKKKGRNQVSYFLNLADRELSRGDIEELGERLCGAGMETIRALALAVDSNDGYYLEDTERISVITQALADDIGLNDEKTETLLLATKLHDIGKVGISGDVLSNRDELSPDDMSRVQQHPEIARLILHEAVAIKDLVSAILYHHERWDGTGYPEQLAGEDIPLMARIVSIMDAYRAMLSDRPYRMAISQQEAVAELRKNAGKQFDPSLVEVFTRIVEQEDQQQLRETG